MNELLLLKKKVRRKDKLLFTELYPNTKHEFKASKGWFTRMCCRNNLVHRRVTSVGQFLAPSGKYPPGMQVLGSKGGTMKRSMMKETYVKRIWKKRPGMFFNTGNSILLMESAKRHLEQGFSDVNSTVKDYPCWNDTVVTVSRYSREQTV